MKRTLFEVVCGLAVIVLVVSLHHQIARLKVRTHDVQRLEAMVHDAVAKVGGHEDRTERSSKALVDLEEKPGGDFLPVKQPGGARGYMHTDYLRSFVDYRFSASKVDGKWLITVFIAGD